MELKKKNREKSNRVKFSKLNLRIILRTILPPVLTFILIVIAFWAFALPTMRSNLINSKKEMIKELTNTAWNLIEHYNSRVKKHELSLQEAKDRVKNRIKNLRYGQTGKDYFWITNLTPKMIMHPYLPQLNGKDLNDYKDPKGKKLFVEMVEVTQKKGAGYVDYHWQWKDDPSRIEPKISYVKIFRPWHWVIGTGIYINDVTNQINNITKRSNQIFIIFGILGLLFSIGISINSIQQEKARIKANKNLEKEKENYRITLNSIGDAVIATDTKGKVVHMNPVATDLTGWDLSQARGKDLDDIFNIINAKTREAVDNPIEKVLEKGQIVGLANHTKLISRNGDEYHIADSGAPIKDEQGNITGSVLVFRDITRHYKNREKLKENERFLESILESIQDGISVLNPDLTIKHVNSVMNRWYSENTPLEGKKCYECYHNKTTPCDPCPTIKCLETGKTQREIVRGLPGSDVEWIELFSYPVINPETEEVENVVEFVRDITDRKKAEENLKKSESKFRALFEGISDAVFVHPYNEDGFENFVEVNQAACEKLGYSREELLNMSTKDISKPGPDRLRNNQQIRKDLKEDRWQIFEARHITRDGKEIPVEISSRLFELEGEQVIMSVARDISERIKAEKEKEMLHEQLVQAQKMESIGTLAGGIAHDFNNILTVIIGLTDLVKSQLDSSDPNYNHLESIHNSAQRAAKLTQQLLLFSRKQDMELNRINLNKTITGLEKMLNRLIGEDIRMENELEDDLWPIKADQGQIEQVITNLAINARDAMPGGGSLEIKTKNVVIGEEKARSKPDLQPGKYVLIEIEDSGHGMDKSIQEKIFDPFFTTKGRAKGTGMGLSVAHGIIKKHKGLINVYSEPGKGSIFRIYLPATQVSGKTTRKEKEKTELEQYRGSGETILIVEDEEQVLKYLENILNNYGYNYFSASSGEEALKIFRQEKHRIDLLLSDVIMTGINGVELADKLKKQEKNLKIILSSGYSDKKVVPDDIREKGFKFIQKPYQMKKLIKQIYNTLHN
jgi:PAS domain S-box-containing protein